MNSVMIDKSGVVYILSNSYMPGLIKIGKTSNLVSDRASQLYTTGVPVPFTCESAWEVADMDATEAALHTAFGDVRINPKREFFKLAPMRARAFLELIGTKDVTPELEKAIDSGISEEEKNSVKKRPRFVFKDFAIVVGSELKLIRDDKIIAIVLDDDNQVKSGVDEGSLSAVTAIVLGKKGAPMRGTDYWTYGGKELREMYYERYL
jgi:hypothetical protein